MRLKRITFIMSILVVSVVGMLTFFVYGWTHHCSAEMKRIPRDTVAVAFTTELRAFLQRVDVKESCVSRGTRYYVAQYNDTEFLLYMSGVGMAPAEMSTRNTLSQFKATSLILAGIVAGVADQNIGDGVVPAMWQNIHTKDTVPVDENLLVLARYVSGVRIVPLGGTSRTFVRSTSMVPKAVAVVDMEAYTMGKVAKEKQVPFISIRSVSDFGDGRTNDHNFTIAADKAAGYTLQFLTALWQSKNTATNY